MFDSKSCTDKMINITNRIGEAATSSDGSGKSKLRPQETLEAEQRIQELSQGESPLLRGLARKLGDDYHIPITQCAQKISKHPYAHLCVGERWMEYQGCNNWKGLLEPDFDPVLKSEVLRYGEFAQATYDAFDNKTGALHHYGTSKYTKTDLLDKIGLPNRGYEIKEFIYTTTNFQSGHLFHRTGKPHVEDHSQSSDAKNGEQMTKDDVGICEHDNETGNENKENLKQSKNRRRGAVSECQHCTENCKECNWMGFVAVCTSRAEIARLGRRDIVIAWRSSVTKTDWRTDIRITTESVVPLSQFGTPGVRVHCGFKHIFESKNSDSRYCQKKSAQDQVRDVVQALVKKYQGEKLSITVTGHSMGSALATLCAYDIALLLSGIPSERLSADSRQDRLNIPGSQFGKDTEDHNTDGQSLNKFQKDRPPITVYSFGGPRVGNKAFRDSMEHLGVAVLRVVNKYDAMTKLPGLNLNSVLQKKLHISNTAILPNYEHVGERLKVFSYKSDFLEKTTPLEAYADSRSHALETYLHLVDSYQGIKANYRKESAFVKRVQKLSNHHPKEDKYKAYKQTFRDHALVNKHQNFLKPECHVPPCWLQEANKGLVIDKSGRLVLPDRDESVPGANER